MRVIKSFKNMKIVQAIRQLALLYVDGIKDYIDEDTYDMIQVVVENTKDHKLIPKLKKHMAPFADLLEMENVTAEDLKNAKIISCDKEPSPGDIANVLQHAKMCYTVIETVSSMDSETLSQIESLSGIMHANLQQQMENINGEDTSPEALFKLLTENMQTTLGQAQDTTGSHGEIGALLSKSLPNMMKTIQSATNEKGDKRNLLDKFATIDGKI